MSSEHAFLCWVITMDEERWAHMQGEVSRTGITAERFDAVRGAAVPESLREAFFDGETPYAPLSGGEIGCYASHLVLLERIVAQGRPGLILEDDLTLDEAVAGLDAMIAHFPSNWGAVRIAGRTKSPWRGVATLSDTHVLAEYLRVPNATGAILWSPQGAAAFLRAHVRRELPIDEDLRRVWEHDVAVYGIEPPLAVQNIFESTITASGRDDSAARYRFAEVRAKRGGRSRARWLIDRFGLAWLLRARLARVMGRKNVRVD